MANIRGLRSARNSWRVQFFVRFLLGNSPACEVYMPTFRNTLFHHRRKAVVLFYTQLPAYEDGTDRVSETSAYNFQTPGNYPEENIQHSE